jgi:hypothetical protein
VQVLGHREEVAQVSKLDGDRGRGFDSFQNGSGTERSLR